MAAVIFSAIVHPNPEGGYAAAFPDLSGVTVTGADMAQLLANAREAVSAHLQSLADEGLEWPKPTAAEQLRPEPPAFALLVDVDVEDPPVRVNISIGEQLLKRLDAAAAARGASRSGFIAQSVRASLGEKPSGGPDFEAAARKLQDELSAMGRKMTDFLGPNSSFSKNMAEFDDRVTETVRKAADSVSAAMARRKEAESRTGKTEPPGEGPATPH
jgi:predicted RNase H-like HicB family nuclease